MPTDRPGDAAAMERRARAQVRLIRERHPDGAGRGHLILAEFTRTALRIWRHCALG